MSAPPFLRPSVAPPDEDQGIFLSARTVMCEDCLFIGIPLEGRCRKCASESIFKLKPLVEHEPSAEAQAAEKGESYV